MVSQSNPFWIAQYDISSEYDFPPAFLKQRGEKLLAEQQTSGALHTREKESEKFKLEQKRQSTLTDHYILIAL